jgi:hypothetical protein
MFHFFIETSSHQIMEGRILRQFTSTEIVGRLEWNLFYSWQFLPNEIFLCRDYFKIFSEIHYESR